MAVDNTLRYRASQSGKRTHIVGRACSRILQAPSPGTRRSASIEMWMMGRHDCASRGRLTETLSSIPFGASVCWYFHAILHRASLFTSSIPPHPRNEAQTAFKSNLFALKHHRAFSFFRPKHKRDHQTGANSGLPWPPQQPSRNRPSPSQGPEPLSQQPNSMPSKSASPCNFSLLVRWHRG